MKQKLQFSKGTALLSHFLKNQWKLLVLTIFIFNIQYQNCQGQAGTALDFDGFDDFVEADNSFDFYSGDFTVEVWFKAAPVSSLGTASSIFNLIDENQTNESAFYLGLNFNGFGHPDNGKMRVNVRPGFDFIGGENFYSTTALDDNTWHHVALTRKSDGFLRLYIDGTLNATSSNAVANITSAKDGLINIGRNAPNAPRLFKGQLDEVRVWTVGLETSDISSLYNKTFTGVSTCLDVYYKFDDGSGTTASNSSSQSSPSRSASLYNMNNSDWVSSSVGVTSANISGCSTLPVELISFIGKIGEDKVSADLVWQTASEENNEGFEIERSQDGKNWETLGFVERELTNEQGGFYSSLDASDVSEFTTTGVHAFNQDAFELVLRV